MGLLDSLYGTPDKAQAMGLLGAMMMQGRTAQGLGAATQFMGQADERAMRKGLLDAQLQETIAQAEERKTVTQQRQAQAEQAARLREAMPQLFQGGGAAGAGAGAQVGGGFDWMRAVQMGMDPKMAQEYAALQNIGRQEVARTVETMQGGRPVTMQFDKYGQPVGQGMEQWKAPVFQNLGDRTLALDPVSLQPKGTFAQGMSPEGRDASARGWAGFNETKRHNSVTESTAGATAAAGRIPAGYRMKPDGTMEAIPGGPADLKAGAEGQKRITDAKDVLGLLDEVDKLLPKATGSYIGAGADHVARAFGGSTDGAEATAQLKTIEGALIGKMPKMSGPQSDKDVQLYRDMAGQVSDPTLPIKTRQAAANTIRSLNEKYAGMQEGSSRAPAKTLQSLPKTAPLGQRVRDTETGKVLKFNGMSWVEEK